MPICDASNPEEIRTEGPCWMCRRYDQDTGKVTAVMYDELKYRYEDTKQPLCINPEKCPNNPILTKSAADWNCEANDFFLTARAAYKCQASPLTGLDKAFEILE